VSNLPPGCGWRPKAVSDCLDIHCPKTCGPSHPTVGSSGAGGGTSSG
jgi:hypothetical protein